MAYKAEGGGGTKKPSLGSGISSAVKSISSSTKKAAAPKKKSVGSGASRGVSNISRAVSNVGRSTSSSGKKKSSGSSKKSSNYSAPRPPARPQPAYRPATPPRVSTPRPPVGNTPGGQIARSVPAPAPVAPAALSETAYLQKDPAFISQQSAYQKALSDYARQFTAEQGKYQGEYDAQTKQLGLDRTEGAANLQDDYASRGLIQSGVYQDALGDFNKKFDTSQSDMERARQAYLDDLTTGKTNFESTQGTLLEKARQEALNRRLDSMKV